MTKYESAGRGHGRNFLKLIIGWLQEGYPEGVPGPDRVPLLALLRSTPLTEDQLDAVVDHLTSTDPLASDDGVIDHDEIAAEIKAVTHHDAGPENIRRVAATLAAAGWPLAGVDVRAVCGDEDREAAQQLAAWWLTH